MAARPGAIAREYVRNLEERRGRPARFVVGEPLPDDGVPLPTAAELERLHGCSVFGGDDVPVEVAYPRSAWDPDVGEADSQAELWAAAPLAQPHAGEAP